MSLPGFFYFINVGLTHGGCFFYVADAFADVYVGVRCMVLRVAI